MFKKLVLLSIFISGVIFSPIGAAASKDAYYFDSPQQQLRFQQLNQQFECVVCQNQNLATSTVPIARDLRYQIYKMVKHNKDDKTIVRFLVERYGDLVIYHAPTSKLTWALWSVLLILLLAGLGRLLWIVRKQQKRYQSINYRFSKKDRERIRHLLQQY
jgi:cytochrome c-type biogenesis protein CcmH